MKIGTINMLYTPKINCHIAPLHPHNGHLSTMTTFFCPQGGRCGEVQLYVDINNAKGLMLNTSNSFILLKLP